MGVRGNRIRSIVDELNSERIDIVRWDDDPEVMIPNALQPAEVDQVLLCDMIGRAIVLVREDQLSLAIGRRGQNVRLASKLCGWDIEIMTAEELDEQIDRAVTGYSALDGVNEDLAAALVEQGYLSYDDLSVIEPDALAEMGDLTMEQVDHIVEQAETRAEEAEVAAEEEKARQKVIAAAEAEAKAKQEAAEVALAATESESDSSTDAIQQDQDTQGTESEEAPEEAGEDNPVEETIEAEVGEGVSTEQDSSATTQEEADPEQLEPEADNVVTNESEESEESEESRANEE